MINDTLKATGELQIVLTDKDGNIKQNTTVPNLVVTTGKAVIASRLVGTATAIMSHMAVGTVNTAPAASQTTLAGESERAVLTSSSSTLNEVNYSSTFGPSTVMAITEAGIFNASSGGTMLCRTVFNVVNKGADDTLSITWTVTIS